MQALCGYMFVEEARSVLEPARLRCKLQTVETSGQVNLQQPATVVHIHLSIIHSTPT